MIRTTQAQDTPRSPVGARRRSWLIAGVIAAVLLASVIWLISAWSGASRSFDASHVRVAEVVRGDLVRDLAADGRVIAANSPTLYAIAGGTVSLKVVAGDTVVEGQELAVIDSPELRSQLVQEESTLASLEGESRRAGLDARLARFDAQRMLDQAQIERTAAERDFERMQQAFDRGAVSKNDLDRARDNLHKAEIGLSAASRSQLLQNQGSDIDAENKQLMAERQLAVVQELRRQVDALTLRAPFDGQVGQVQVAQGTNVAVNAPVLSVVDLSVFELEIRVPESFARDLAIGIPARIRSATDEFSAQISAVSPEVVNSEVTARLRFDEGQQPPGLRQNQRLSARVLLDRREDVLMVERGPFVNADGGHFAYVVDGGTAVRRPIQLGVSSLSSVEILSGLNAGERIVVAGSDQFDGAERVRLSGR